MEEIKLTKDQFIEISGKVVREKFGKERNIMEVFMLLTSFAFSLADALFEEGDQKNEQ